MGLALILALACGRADARPGTDSMAIAREDSIARARQDSINRAQPGYVIDSILPVEEELRRFRTGLGEPLPLLENAGSSRERLIHAFATAVSRADTALLRRLAISRAEFAWLVYPQSPFTREPYRQSPELLWRQISAASESGLRRLLDRFGGKPLRVAATHCEAKPELQERNRIWRGCALEIETSAGTSRRARLFGDIIERDGRYKFVGYGNDL